VEADPRRWLALAVRAAATLMVVLDTSIVEAARSPPPTPSA